MLTLSTHVKEITVPEPAEITRERLVRVAGELLERDGLNAVTLRAVGAAAGVSRGAPYRHFKDKSDLLAAVAARGLSTLAASMTSRNEDDADPVDRLAGALRAFVDGTLRAPEAFVTIFGPDVDRQSVELRQAGLAGYADLRTVVSNANRSALPTDLAGATLWATMHGAVMLVLAGHTEPDTYLDDPLNLIMRAAEGLLGIQLSRSGVSRSRAPRSTGNKIAPSHRVAESNTPRRSPHAMPVDRHRGADVMSSPELPLHRG
jgi:AcrR family transcriptional regulator